MRRYTIVPIVEGHGEVHAVPIILRRWFRFRRFLNFDTLDLAVRAHHGSLICAHDPDREQGIECYVARAAARRPDAILVILDADDVCIERRGRPAHEQLGPELLLRARSVIPHVPVAVVVANREFEAWYLASYRRLKQRTLFSEDLRFEPGFDVERPRDCKGRVSQCIGRRYSPTADQKVLAEHIGFRAYMGRYSPSFGKLLRDLERIAHEARCATRDRSRSDRQHLDKGSQTQ